MFATSSVVASKDIIGAAPVHTTSLPDVIPLARLGDVAFASSFDPRGVHHVL